MEIRKVSDSISIYSDGKRLQVIHNLGDEFILDFKIEQDDVGKFYSLNPRIEVEVEVMEWKN